MPGIMSDEGDLLLTSLRPRSTLPVKNGTVAGRKSLLSTMNQFIAAVNEMDGAVMIPCKLQDMQLDNVAPLLSPNGTSSDAIGASQGACTSTSPPMKAIQNGQTDSDSKTLVSPPGDSVINGADVQDPKHLNLYNYYGMLRAIKAELVCGPSSVGEEEDEANGLGRLVEDDIAKQTATMFRHHLRGLFDVLQNMTSTADLLTTQYQTEIGDNSLSSTRSLAHYTL